MIFYRNEWAFGDGYRDAAEVLAYEIAELGNTDALHYIFRNYDIPREIRRKWCKNVRVMAKSNVMDAEDIHDNVRELLNAVESSTGKKINFVLWLASKLAVETFYSGTPNNIDAYEVDGAVVLSDLGADGILFGFEENPEPLAA